MQSPYPWLPRSAPPPPPIILRALLQISVSISTTHLAYIKKNSHISKAGVVHQLRHVRHAAATAEVVGHLSQLRVVHEVAQHVGVAHEVLGHAREHGVAHDRAQIGHTAATAAAAAAASKHAGQRRQVGHTAAAAAAAARGTRSLVDSISRRLAATADLCDLSLRSLKAPLHGITATVTLGFDTLLVGLLGAVEIGNIKPGESQPAPRLGVLGIDRNGELGIVNSLLVLSGRGVGSSAVGEINRVGGGGLQRLGVALDSGGVVLAGHRAVSLGLQLIGFGRRGASLGLGALLGRAGLRLSTTAGGCLAGGLSPELLINTVDARQRLATHGILDRGLVGRVDLEGIGDARLGDLDRLRIVSSQGAVFQAGAQKVDDRKRQALVGFCRGLIEILVRDDQTNHHTVYRARIPYHSQIGYQG
ncbi:hypothetical protein P168DRAFT_97197 [Aspergillus campestris IBT 28561]|uniref:Uncharacterized protein n=1 Tax=Aspergillus campestris (strain IBT 28561) TaxID=1392248 RepID=A0A2I1DC84_ASPC2|nr:uncharacterized protein P168DRAFT_97197 [Aspergillus campestris IBT 28561]PKY07492.1 hypothetical protein P168DRAFT_97197 [Aspergillus campestris IBT 28561]